MKQPVLICALAGAITGAGSATLTAIVMAPPTVQTTSAPTALEFDAEESVARQIGAIGEEIEALARRIDLLEQTPIMSAPSRVSAAPEASMVEELDAVAQVQKAMMLPNGDPNPLMMPYVEQALQAIRDQEERERDERRHEQALERVEERITELTEKLGLDKFQADNMRTILTDQSIRRDDMMREARESGDFGTIRETMQTMRDEYHTQIAAVLSPAQFDQYKETENDFGRGFRGFGRGDEPGGNPRGDGGGTRRDSGGGDRGEDGRGRDGF